MQLVQKNVQTMNEDELVNELMGKFKEIYHQLNHMEIQASYQTKRILHLESVLSDIHVAVN